MAERGFAMNVIADRTGQDSRSIRRCLVPGCAIAFLFLASVFALLAVASMRMRIGSFPLGAGTYSRISGGRIEVWRTYAQNIAPGVPEAQWHAFAVSRGWVLPRSDSSFWRFEYYGRLVCGEMEHDGTTVSPANYWLAQIPIWPAILLALIPGALFIRKWNHRRHRSQRGFAIEPIAHLPQTSSKANMSRP